MSKGKNRNMGYNRQSGGYQRNMQKHYMNQEGIKQPKTMDPKKFRIIAICAGILWVIACVLLSVGYVLLRARYRQKKLRSRIPATRPRKRR